MTASDLAALNIHPHDNSLSTKFSLFLPSALSFLPPYPLLSNSSSFSHSQTLPSNLVMYAAAAESWLRLQSQVTNRKWFQTRKGVGIHGCCKALTKGLWIKFFQREQGRISCRKLYLNQDLGSSHKLLAENGGGLPRRGQGSVQMMKS